METTSPHQGVDLQLSISTESQQLKLLELPSALLEEAVVKEESMYGDVNSLN